MFSKQKKKVVAQQPAIPGKVETIVTFGMKDGEVETNVVVGGKEVEALVAVVVVTKNGNVAAHNIADDDLIAPQALRAMLRQTRNLATTIEEFEEDSMMSMLVNMLDERYGWEEDEDENPDGGSGAEIPDPPVEQPQPSPVTPSA